MVNLHPCVCPLAGVCSRDSGPFREVQRQKHSILYVEGLIPTHVYLLRRGTVSLHRMGREDRAWGRTRALRRPSSLLGLESLTDRPSKDSARAETPLRLCIATQEQMKEWMDQESPTALMLKIVLQTEDDELIPKASPDGSAEQRVVSWLLDPHHRDYTKGAPRHVIAELLGMRAETFSRLLRRLAEEGLIELSRSEVCVNDPEALRGKLPI